MYIPQPFQVRDIPTLHTMIERIGFGQLITNADGRIECSHLPFVLRKEEGRLGALLGHMAKANPQWERAEAVLVTFLGPHAYISPVWYGIAQQVPTWDYIAVHARGRFERIEKVEETREVVETLITQYDPNPEKARGILTDEALYHAMLSEIVAFRITVVELAGQWKLSQNKSLDVRRRVIAHLEASSSQTEHYLANAMREQFGDT